jgi:hypothetical protein
MKVRLYRENEVTGKIENNDSSAWPVRVINSEYRKLKGYDMNRVYLPNITEIRMKTKEGFNPIIFKNNNNSEIYGLLVIKYGVPDTINKRSDYINQDNSLKYEKLIGRKFSFQLLNSGIRFEIRCTIINPNVADYKGYLFPAKFNSSLVDGTKIKFTKDDFLTTKEKILSSDVDHLQLKMDGLDKIQNIKREKRTAKRKKKIKQKIEENFEKEKLLAKGFTLEEIKKKNLAKKNKLIKEKNKLMQGYLSQKKSNNKLTGSLENHHENENVDVQANPLEGSIKDHDIRISEEDEEIRSHQKKKVNEDDVTEEISFRNNIEYVNETVVKTNRKYSSQKDLERYQAIIHKGHNHSHRMLMQVERKRNHLCLI